MRSTIHQIALRAAARVTIVSTTFACGGALVQEATEDAGESANPAPDASANVQAQLEAGAVGDAVANDGAPECALDDRSFECCERLVRGALPADGGARAAQDASDPITACCRVLSAHYDDPSLPGDAANNWEWSSDHDIKPMCCEAIAFRSESCTPWGPPVPPEMPGAAELAA